MLLKSYLISNEPFLKYQQMCDMHEYLLFHTTTGKFVDYTCLQKLALLHFKSGTSVSAFHKSIVTNCKSLNLPFSCNYKIFLIACDGFIENIEWDIQLTFSCKNCGITPAYFRKDHNRIGSFFILCILIKGLYMLIVDHCQQTSNDGEKEKFSSYFYSFNRISLRWCPPVIFPLFEGNRVNTFCFKLPI